MKRKRPIPQEIRAAVAAAYRTQSAKMVAEQHGVHETTVLYIVREYGDPVRVKDKPLSRDEWQNGLISLK